MILHLDLFARELLEQREALLGAHAVGHRIGLILGVDAGAVGGFARAPSGVRQGGADAVFHELVHLVAQGADFVSGAIGHGHGRALLGGYKRVGPGGVCAVARPNAPFRGRLRERKR